MNKHSNLLLIAITLCSLLPLRHARAQRLQQPLGRGVVAVQSGNNVTITWRRLAQDPENARWNVYLRKNGSGDFQLLNTQPLDNTNMKTTTSLVPVGTEVAVQMVYAYGGEDRTGEMSLPFTLKKQALRNIFMEIAFNGSPLRNADVSTKFVWPVDLNGNGEYDYVVDRNSVSSDRHYLEAYLADGTYLWTIDLGPNEWSSTGQDDQICAYDIDCDGLGEVIVQTSDGTRFWDKANNTWGLYVNGSATGDTDNDGIIDYTNETQRNAPRYFTVVDGLTGAEKASVEQAYDEAYNRTNKASLMGDEYNKHVGHVGIFYHDGIHPAVVMEWHTRTSSGGHMYRNSAFAFDFDSEGKAGNWHQLFMRRTGGATFHQIRIFDADGDGKDEMSSGAYCMDHDGSTLYNTGISHGDRHRTADIDPLRPGLETFSIQQDAPDMLAQILFDAGTGEPIKKWYLPAVGDVGRGECLDLDKDHLGWEMFSTMDGYQVFDARGEKIEGLTGYFPTEGIWWDGELDRERVDSPDGNGYNADIRDFRNGRLIEMAKESGYTLKSSNGKRGKFWGDIIGDWREELILNREVDGVNTGIVGFTTDYTTNVNHIYCLQEDPHYRADCTTRGYYQSPDPGFYLGYDMPRPQLPPCMREDGKNMVCGIALGNATVTPREGLENLYLMPVKGQTLTLADAGSLHANTTVWKSQQGVAEVACNVEHVAKVVISEGTMALKNATVKGEIDLRARGTLAGSGKVGSLVFEGALNSEGCRLKPQPSLTVGSTLNIDRKTYIEIDIDAGSTVNVEGDVNLTAPLVFSITSGSYAPGSYTLLNYTGAFTGSLSAVSFAGLTGLSYTVNNVADGNGGRIELTIDSQRQPYDCIYWTGSESGAWDYQTANWADEQGEELKFVAGDGVLFDDRAASASVSVSELMPVGKVTFDGTKAYALSGKGGLSGNGDLYKKGQGTLSLYVTKSDYTGNTVLESGIVRVKEIADKGTPSSIGTGENGSLQIGRATLVIDNTNTSTDRTVVLTGDTASISVPAGTVSLKGLISGNGTMKKVGNGQLNITYAGANTWNGTVLHAGTLAMGAWNTTFGKSKSPIHVIGNATIAMFDNNSTSAMPSFDNAVTIDKGKTLTFNAGSRCKVQGTLSGEGSFKISFPYVRGDFYTNCSDFGGTLEVTSGQFRLRQALNLKKGTLKLGGGVYAAGFSSDKNEGSYTHQLGGLTSTAADAQLSTGVWNVGYAGGNDTYAGTFNASATLNKYGSGILTLTGESAGNLNIYEGEVEAKNSNAAVTTGLITVRSGGLLDGAGMVNSVVVQKGGTVGAGKSASTAVSTLTVNGNLTMNAGATLRVRTRSTATRTTCDALNVKGKVTLASPKFVFSELSSSYTCAENAELKVLKAEGSISVTGDITIVPAQPAPGLTWDCSELESNGIIRVVKDPTAIDVLTIGDVENKEVYDLKGNRIDRVTVPGIYIWNKKKVVVTK